MADDVRDDEWSLDFVGTGCECIAKLVSFVSMRRILGRNIGIDDETDDRLVLEMKVRGTRNVAQERCRPEYVGRVAQVETLLEILETIARQKLEEGTQVS